MRMTGIGIAATGLLVLLPASLAAQDLRYRGICDASAAVALDDDHFVVGEDESNLLYVYRRGGTNHVKTIDLITYLDSRDEDGDVDEADIEAAAQVGNVIYWLASHGRASDGDLKKTRWRFFATDVVQTANGPTVEKSKAKPYKDLQKALLAEKNLEPLGLAKAAKKSPKHKKGFNIEGLAATPQGHLLIGFRNPRPKGKAIIVPLTNPKAVIENGKAPKFGKPELLDLGGRGISSIERVGERYLIAAGPYGRPDRDKPGSDFALYTWNGPGTTPSQTDVDLGTLNPEAVFSFPGAKKLVIVSDDGNEKVGCGVCKKATIAEKSFRARTLQLP